MVALGTRGKQQRQSQQSARYPGLAPPRALLPNNGSEQDIRPTKIRLKIAGCPISTVLV